MNINQTTVKRYVDAGLRMTELYGQLPDCADEDRDEIEQFITRFLSEQVKQTAEDDASPASVGANWAIRLYGTLGWVLGPLNTGMLFVLGLLSVFSFLDPSLLLVVVLAVPMFGTTALAAKFAKDGAYFFLHARILASQLSEEQYHDLQTSIEQELQRRFEE